MYLTYLLTPWSRVLLEKLTGSAASQEIPRIFGTRRFITVLTSARHLSLYWANSIQSPQTPPTSWRSILILSSHLRLGLPSGLFPSGVPTRTLCTPLPSPIRATFIIIITIIIFITCMHGIYNYIPATNPVSTVHSVAAVLYLQFVLHVMLFRLWNVYCTLHQHFPQYVCSVQYGCFL